MGNRKRIGMNENRVKSRKKIVWTVIAAGFLIIFLDCGVYVSDYYHADTEAIAAFGVPEGITEEVLEDGTLVFVPEEPVAGFIFYPGGKVEYTTYTPLMRACAAQGLQCVLLEMPFNLAVLDVNAAEGIREKYPEIEEWYIGGHSLGGSMAASYLSEHTDAFEGLILLGSYSTEDLSQGETKVLSVYGSEDLVLNREKYAENRANLPEDYTELVIEGGCHANFGMYGAQKGDGMPAISREEQISGTVVAISEFVQG